MSIRQLKRLQRAVKRWVRAEWQFRLGPMAYTSAAQDFYVRAEERLRRALTGHRGLGTAGRKLGLQEVSFRKARKLALKNLGFKYKHGKLKNVTPPQERRATLFD